MDKHVLDVITRAVKIVPLTAAEENARVSEEAAWFLEKNARALQDGIAEARAAARAAVVEKIIEAELAKPTSDIPEIETLRTALGGR